MKVYPTSDFVRRHGLGRRMDTARYVPTGSGYLC
jgi:hypothetical protein